MSVSVIFPNSNCISLVGRVLSENSSHKQILRSSSIIGSASIVNVLIGLVRIKVVAVLLGPAGVGLIGILQTLMSVASTASSLGVGNVGTRQIAQAAGQNDQAGIDSARRALFWGTMVLSLVGGLIFWSLRSVLAMLVMNDPEVAPLIGWITVGVMLAVAASAQSALLTGMRRIADIAKMRILSAMLCSIIGVSAILWLGERGLIIYVLSVPFAAFVVSHVFVLRLPRIQSARTPLSVLYSQWSTMIRLGAAFMFAGLFAILGQLVLRALVQRELGGESLGYFQAASTISVTYLGFVLGAMSTDYYPRLAAAIKNPDLVNRLVNEQTEVALLLIGPVLLVLLALLPWLIPLLYSSEFQPAVGILRWQILGDALKVVSWPLGFVMLASGAGKTFVFAEAVAISTFIGVVWVGMPSLGVEATGVGFVAMYALYLPLVYLLSRVLTEFRWSKVVKRDALFLVLSAVLVSLCGQRSDLLGVSVGFVVASSLGGVAVYRLMKMSEVSGPAGKLFRRLSRIIKSRET